MVKSIFVDPLKLKGIEKSGANHLIVNLNKLNQTIWQKLSLPLAISVTAFDKNYCPSNPKALQKLLKRLNQALAYKHAEIWLDHFRFDGHWESTVGDSIPGIHQDCRYCTGRNRVQILSDIARTTMQYVNNRAKIGYFAVPFKIKEVPQLVTGLGQDHSIIGKIFDASSPMLYQRMIKKPVSYISDFVSWMHKRTGKPVLPIIQIKDMPDDLQDLLTEKEISQAFHEAIKPPSSGVCFFYWTQALEKNKTQVIAKLFSHC